MASAPPRFNGLMWWIDRWRKSTAFTDMNLEQQGAYRNLLDEATLRGGALPDDDRVLAKACGDPRRWRALRPILLKRFTLGEDGWRNDTLDHVLREALKRMNERAIWRDSKRRKRGGQVGGQPGGQVGGQTGGQRGGHR